jgi:hypothetical protein
MADLFAAILAELAIALLGVTSAGVLIVALSLVYRGILIARLALDDDYRERLEEDGLRTLAEINGEEYKPRR